MLRFDHFLLKITCKCLYYYRTSYPSERTVRFQHGSDDQGSTVNVTALSHRVKTIATKTPFSCTCTTQTGGGVYLREYCTGLWVSMHHTAQFDVDLMIQKLIAVWAFDSYMIVLVKSKSL